MAATPADVKETPKSYVFVVDVPGLNSDMIQVKVEDDNVLTVCGERKREKEKDQGIRYLRMERRLGKYLKKFVLPDNADIEKISAECQDGVLTVTIEKKPPAEPKKPKTIQVQIHSDQGGGQGGEGDHQQGARQRQSRSRSRATSRRRARGTWRARRRPSLARWGPRGTRRTTWWLWRAK